MKLHIDQIKIYTNREVGKWKVDEIETRESS
jgi:hypothetical protein